MSVVFFLVILVALVVVHELGHFLFAKLFKIKVEEFGVGYPPKALTLGKIGETVYTLNWLPFGGFVRILGESNDAKISPKDKNRALINKHPLAQIAVLFGGVLFNFLFAWVLFSASFMLGAPTPADPTQNEQGKLIISQILPNSPADESGLKVGDQILNLEAQDGKQIKKTTPTAVSEFIQQHVGEEIVFTVLHMGEQSTSTVVLTPAQGILTQSPSKPAVGIAMNYIVEKPLGLFKSVYYGTIASFEALGQVTKGLFTLFKNAFTEGINWNQVAGPVGIVGVVSDASSIGFIYLLHVIAFISINLVVINLIPLPALDGGRIVMVATEWVIRRKIPTFIVTGLNLIGFSLLILFMVFVTYHDILKMFN